MKVGDLVKLRPGTAEGDEESLGVGLVVEEGRDNWNNEFVYIQFNFSSKPWFRYKEDVEVVNESR
jgi:hypothetical protein